MARALLNTLRVRLPIACLAAVLAAEIVLATGLVSGWGRWYSHDLTYRRQTEALLRGEMALSHEATGLWFDMAWAEGGVQQVWGLGVPLWRLPFEALARAFSQPAFPDRLALALAIFLAGYTLLWAFVPPASCRTAREWIDAATTRPEGLTAALVLMLFPPLLALCNGPLNRYEEPLVYGYYASIALFALTLAFVRGGGLTIYAAICLLAGLIGFIRPTLFVYGLSSIAVSFFTRRRNWSWRRNAWGLALFVAGGMALYASNVLRFGAGTEFGHNLNASGAEIMYASRFGAPFDQEPLSRRGLELLGAVFFVQYFNGSETSAEDVVKWQIPVSRWRHFYSRTFDGSYLLILVACWAWAAARLSRRTKGALRTMPPGVVAAVWSLSSALPLAVFYVYYYSISSRYLLDFAPALGASVAGVLLEIRPASRACRRRAVLRAGALVLAAAWWAAELHWAENLFPQRPAWGRVHVINELRRDSSTPTVLPSHYAIGEENGPWESGILFNGFGWDHAAGKTQPMAMFFVDDAANVQLEVEPAEGEILDEQSLGSIRAKIGLEFLMRQSVERTERGWRITFARPKRAAYRQGVQVLFVAFVPPNDYRKESSPFRLIRVDWK